MQYCAKQCNIASNNAILRQTIKCTKNAINRPPSNAILRQTVHYCNRSWMIFYTWQKVKVKNIWRAEDRDTERSWVNVVLRTGGQTAVQILVPRRNLINGMHFRFFTKLHLACRPRLGLQTKTCFADPVHDFRCLLALAQAYLNLSFIIFLGFAFFQQSNLYLQMCQNFIL